MQKKNKVFNRYFVSFSDKLDEFSYKVYKNTRLFFAKFKPLSDIERYQFKETDRFVEELASPMPEGFNYIENKKEEGYLKLDYLDLFDYLPKENLENFVKEIKKLIFKNDTNLFAIHNTKKDIEELDSFGEYFDGYAFKTVASLALEKNKHLKNYCSDVSISLRNLSSTFLVVKYRFYIKQEFNEKIENLCKTEFKGYSKISRQFNIPWYNPKKFGKEIYIGAQTREKKLYELLSDLKWCILKELKKTLTFYFWGDNMFPPCFETYSTNIRPSNNRENLEFWQSVMFGRVTDYAPEYNACVCWDYNHSADEGVRLAAYCGGDYAKGEFLPGIVHHDISDVYAVYLVAKTLECVAKRDIAIYNRKISRAIKKKKNTSVLKVRVDVERNLYHSYRFVSEFTGNSINYSETKNFRNEVYKNGSFSHGIMKGLVDAIKKSKEQTDNVLKLLNDAAEYRSSEANMKVQHEMMVITIMSLIIALISIDNDIKIFLKDIFSNLYEFIIGIFK